jgi:soluble lytic murein transglycosylase
VGTPISLARAGYWEGRAHEALGDPVNAAAAHAFAAEFQTTFYGLLAAERAGLAMDPALAGTSAVAWRGRDFVEAPLMRAVHLLRGAGEWHLARRFLLHVAEGLGAEDLEALGEYVLDLGEPNWAVNVARVAGAQGIELVRAGYPLTSLAEAELRAPADLVLAIARRESEFDPEVISPADARGLMQLLPATARQMAARLGEGFEESRLLSDPDQNARLGAAYLAVLIDEFGPGVALVAAGYNAGPGRPRTWIGTLGDPRTMDADALIDWVERVPFAETRNYIMRVTESLMVYRARLNGAPVAPAVSTVLRGR